MESNDPFGSIAELCHVSSSQQRRLHCSRFAGEPDEPLLSADDLTESPEFPVESTAVLLVSLPETSEYITDDNNTPPNIFQTPPQEPAAVDHHRDEDQTADGEDCTDGAAAVDLGRDTDLGFSEVEVELTQRIESEEFQSESEKVRVLKRNSPSNQGINESPSKRSKISDQNSGLETPKAFLGTETEINRERISPCNYGAKCPQNHQQGSENCEERLTKRELDFSKEVLESRIEESNGVSDEEKDGLEKYKERRKRVEDIDKFRYVGPSARKEAQAMRVLPVSIQGPVEDGGAELEAEKNCREVTLLDVLKIFAHCDYGYLKELSVLDVAKSRGMTFPRPSWWPEEGFEVVDD